MYGSRAHKKKRVQNLEVGGILESCDINTQTDVDSNDEMSERPHKENSRWTTELDTRDKVSTLYNQGPSTQQPPLVSNSNTCTVSSVLHRDVNAETDYSSQDEVRFIVPSVRNNPQVYTSEICTRRFTTTILCTENYSVRARR